MNALGVVSARGRGKKPSRASEVGLEELVERIIFSGVPTVGSDKNDCTNVQHEGGQDGHLKLRFRANAHAALLPWCNESLAVGAQRILKLSP